MYVYIYIYTHTHTHTYITYVSFAAGRRRDPGEQEAQGVQLGGAQQTYAHIIACIYTSLYAERDI